MMQLFKMFLQMVTLMWSTNQIGVFKGLTKCVDKENEAHRTRVSVIRHEILQCWNWYGSDLQTLEDQAHQVLKKFHDVDPR